MIAVYFSEIDERGEDKTGDESVDVILLVGGGLV